MKRKNFERPEFQVVKQSVANAKFFVASFGNELTDTVPQATASVTVVPTNGWF